MGASGWEYVVPYQQDLGGAIDSLRREVFAAGDYVKSADYGDVFDLPEPASVEDLTEQEQYWEFMGTSGTHSIIDVLTVIPSDFADNDFATIRPLSDAERSELFGTAQPSRTDYEPLAGTERAARPCHWRAVDRTSSCPLGTRSAHRDRILGLLWRLTSAPCARPGRASHRARRLDGVYPPFPFAGYLRLHHVTLTLRTYGSFCVAFRSHIRVPCGAHIRGFWVHASGLPRAAVISTGLG
jgi:hypothetical protein